MKYLLLVAFALVAAAALMFNGGDSHRAVAQDAPPEAEGDFDVIGVSWVLCFLLVAVDPDGLGGLDATNCNSLDLSAAGLNIVADVLGDGDDKVELTDFQGAVNLDGNHVHQSDPGNSAATNGTLFVIVFVEDNGSVTFTTDRGIFTPLAGTDPDDDTWTCDTPGEDLDCVGDAGGDGVVIVRLRANNLNFGTFVAERGDGVVTIGQGSQQSIMRFTIVGEPQDVTVGSVETTIQNGVVDLNDDGDFGDDDECQLPGGTASFIAALGTPERSIVIARAIDSDDVAVTQGLIGWSVDKPEVARMATGITPTLDLGSFGFGAPNVICGTDEPGTVKITANLQNTAAPVADLVADEAAIPDTATTEVTVVGVPATLELAAVPPSIDCNGINTSSVSATVKDADGNTARPGQEVRFDVQVRGTASPIVAKTNDMGVATSVITPLAAGQTGITVNVTVNEIQEAILVSCGGPGAAPPPGSTTAPGAATPRPGGIAGPDTGTGGPSDDGAPGVWAYMVAVAVSGLVVLGAGSRLARRRF